MADTFDVTLSTKDRPVLVPVTVGKTEVWARLEVGGLIAFAYPFFDTTYDHEIDVFGGQGTIVAGKFRVPTGNAFAFASFAFSQDYAEVEGVLTPRRFVSSDPKSSSYATSFGVEVMTRTPNIVLYNRVVNADRRVKP